MKNFDPGGEDANASPLCCAEGRLTRRGAIAFGACVGLGLGGGIISVRADPADERPRAEDLLVAIDGPGPTALSPSDISNAPILAWPMEPEGNVVRSGSRLNKIVLVRLDPATLKATTQARSAAGIVAYSAICPHAGCEVNGWVAEQSILECPCHNSRYDPSNAAAIVDGPTTRALAALPLKIANGKLVVAASFSGRLGIAPT